MLDQQNLDNTVVCSLDKSHANSGSEHTKLRETCFCDEFLVYNRRAAWLISCLIRSLYPQHRTSTTRGYPGYRRIRSRRRPWKTSETISRPPRGRGTVHRNGPPFVGEMVIIAICPSSQGPRWNLTSHTKERRKFSTSLLSSFFHFKLSTLWCWMRSMWLHASAT